MNHVWEYLIPEYIRFWLFAGWEKFVRIYWYFFLFELTRFISIDFLVALYFKLSQKKRNRAWNAAKVKLFAENPLISIIVPGKNEGKHLYKLTNSLAEQTYKNFELIIVDDGSDDNSAIIGKNLEKLGLIHTFLRNNIRGGKASAANLALRFSKGSIIVHLDADCSFDVDAIENIIIPFYMGNKIGAVGGNIKVRNHHDNLCTKLQAIEYLKTVSIGRIIASTLGIYKIISGAFGAFRKDVIDQVGGWDIGPGLDGDITVKIRKSGYKTIFSHRAVCLTNAPSNFKILTKQRLRWNKSLIRFRLRKHFDVYLPHQGFSWSNFFALFENVFYNFFLHIAWWIYIIDMLIHYNSSLDFIIYMNLTLYCFANFLQMLNIYIFSERRTEELHLWKYLPLMSIYTGLYLRLVRTKAYFDELFFKKSYNDSWNPVKSSSQAKLNGF